MSTIINTKEDYYMWFSNDDKFKSKHHHKLASPLLVGEWRVETSFILGGIQDIIIIYSETQ
jgi:hypothetical protein